METPFVTSIIQKVAEEIGAVVLLDPECTFVGLITFKNGNKSFFRTSRFSINSSGRGDAARTNRGTRHQVQQEWLAAQRTGFSAPLWFD
ncbi:hypothetical protein [Nostoc sp.]|uniref:hypothetical protein n=1 Tax=Nostoc sp. TaxID=1180 RepID=UPI002FF590BA